MRVLAAERAEKLERELKRAAEAGLKVEISRTLEARGKLQAAAKRKSTVRYSGIAALGVLLGIASLGMGLTHSQKLAVPARSALETPMLDGAPGDRLKLAFSYSVSLPAAR